MLPWLFRLSHCYDPSAVTQLFFHPVRTCMIMTATASAWTVTIRLSSTSCLSKVFGRCRYTVMCGRVIQICSSYRDRVCRDLVDAGDDNQLPLRSKRLGC
ncbi:hypothetical protein MLPF_1727 [Mycobacterium lepromatosis]|nr:hypothetical protein MLPF_1727 [Mycobacterium lepromatosis]